MDKLAKHVLMRTLALLLSLSLAFAQNARAAQAQPEYTQQELDQMLAPIALYPDALLSQILMAATYPLEVVEAARWSRANPGLQGDAAVQAVAQKDWDPSVKSLAAFPQILSMMDQKLDWTEKLGDAFLAQEPQVMDTVQVLRQKAVASGNLRSSEQAAVSQQGQTIIVAPANPQVVYVPYYDPWLVYGPWWWPSYPPVYWAPWPGYYVRPGVRVAFVWGAPIGISAGFFFGAFDWPRRHVHVVNVNTYYYNTVIVNRRTTVAPSMTPGVWRHDPAHRRGVAYHSESIQRQFAPSNTVSTPRHSSRSSDAPAPTGRSTPSGRLDTTDTRAGARTEQNQHSNRSDARIAAPQPETRVHGRGHAAKQDGRNDSAIRPDSVKVAPTMRNQDSPNTVEQPKKRETDTRPEGRGRDRNEQHGGRAADMHAHNGKREHAGQGEKRTKDAQRDVHKSRAS